MEHEKYQKVIRIVLTLVVVLAGAYYIKKSASVTEILSSDVVNDAQADVPGPPPKGG